MEVVLSHFIGIKFSYIIYYIVFSYIIYIPFSPLGRDVFFERDNSLSGTGKKADEFLKGTVH